MKVGIGVPASNGMKGSMVLDWARKADAGPFSSLATIDRVVYGNYEPLTILSAAAGATQRIRLMTSILLAPIRNGGVLAKQAASLDAISGGRLTLGIGVGGREDDYRAAPASFHDRGKRLSEQLALMKRIWTGEPVGEGIGPVGPPPAQPGGPEILLGGFSPPALRRAGQWADGFLGALLPPEQMQQMFGVVQGAWTEAGRSGQPRLVAARYYRLGPNTQERGEGYIRDYYAFAGPMAEQIVQSILSTPEAIKEAMQAYEGVGADELLLWPTVAELDQIDRLAEVVS
jgi:alkanesulfonate monooxygenase SsuD/methylene tetrahydromethanopterin reductase-like flavin-dependent oxidoreductase (luciferase family)